MKMELRHLTILGGAALAVGVSSAAFAGHDPVIYDNGASDYNIGSPASQLDPVYPFDAGAADDFILGPSGQGDGSWNITDVHWAGVTFGPGGVAPITSFNIIFWADVGGMPGGGQAPGLPPDYTQALAIYNIAGNANQTLAPGGDGVNNFDYWVDLPVAFNAAANTSYWIEIQPVTIFPPQWALQQTANQTGGVTHQGFDILNLAFWTPANSQADSSFQLSGVPVPAPGALALLGVAGLAGMRRRRRK